MSAAPFSLAATVLMLICLLPMVLTAAPLRIAESPIEIVVSEINGGRTVQVKIVPLDAQGQARPSPESSVLADFQATERLRERDLDGPREVRVGELTVSLRPRPLSISIRRADGTIVQEIEVNDRDGSIAFHTKAPVFGLGEGRQQYDRRGFYYNFINGQTTFLATHSATIPVPLLIGTDGWMMFIHNPSPPTGNPREDNRPWGAFDLRGEDAGPAPATNVAPSDLLAPPDPLPTRGRFIPRPDTLNQAPIYVYISALDRPADAMEEYVRLTGRPVMPPRWVMGYMQSHRTLAGPHEPIKVAEAFRNKQLPCDALIYLGTGYTNGPTGWNMGHGSLEFNPLIFDKPQEMLDKLHALNFRVILHKNAPPPGLFGKSVSESSDDPIHISNYWATHLPLMKMGVDGWWPDDGDNLPIEARLARHRLYYEGCIRDRPNVRPWSLHRNGYAGVARFGGWIWSGDVQSRWVTLANHIPVGLNYSLSVSPFWGSDTGGFFLTRPNEYTGELYVRWFQFSAFNPLFRSHGRNWKLHLPWGWNTGDLGPKEMGDRVDYPPESELRNATVEPICKQYLELRYRMLPYNYTLMREACDTGVPPMRALWLHYPDDEQATKLGDEYLWGRDMLVAPVVEKGARSRRVYLPAGDWHDWWTGERFSGKRWIERPVDLATLPLYVRAGAIIPLDPVRQHTSQPVTEPTEIRVYPGADGQFVMYDDDGQGLGYRDGSDPEIVWIRFNWNDATRTLRIAPDERMKQWPAGKIRVFDAHCVNESAPPARVEFRGETIEMKL